MSEPGQESKPRKQIFFGRAARVAGVCAGILFILPERVFAANWVKGLLIQFGLIGVPVVIGVVFGHLSD